jgi:hypothetical protein
MKLGSKCYQAIIIIVILLMPLFAIAQPGFGSDVNDSGAPLDGGLSVLAVAGAGYGLKKIREARNKRKKTSETDSDAAAK